MMDITRLESHRLAWGMGKGFEAVGGAQEKCVSDQGHVCGTVARCANA